MSIHQRSFHPKRPNQAMQRTAHCAINSMSILIRVVKDAVTRHGEQAFAFN